MKKKVSVTSLSAEPPMNAASSRDWFELCLNKYPDLPSVVLIRSMELKFFPRSLLREPVLDLCCGDGFFASCLGAAGISGCDIDQRAIAAAQALTGTYREVLHSDARSLDVFSDNAFNTVFSNCALEHIDGIDAAISSISRVLKPGGHLIMSVPDACLDDWFFPARLFRSAGFLLHARRICSDYARKQQHHNIFTRDAWKEKLIRRGLAAERVFFLFSRRQYALVTLFESFVVDSFPGPLFRKMDVLFRRVVPLNWRKKIWRLLLKPIYEKSEERAVGGELFLIARKIR